MSRVKIERAEAQAGKIVSINHRYHALRVAKFRTDWLELTMCDSHYGPAEGFEMSRLLSPEEARDLGLALVEFAEENIR